MDEERNKKRNLKGLFLNTKQKKKQGDKIRKNNKCYDLN